MKCDLVEFKLRTLFRRVLFKISSIKRGDTVTFKRAINIKRAAKKAEGNINFVADGDKSGATQSLAAVVEASIKGKNTASVSFAHMNMFMVNIQHIEKKCKRCFGINYSARKSNKK